MVQMPLVHRLSEINLVLDPEFLPPNVKSRLLGVVPFSGRKWLAKLDGYIPDIRVYVSSLIRGLSLDEMKERLTEAITQDLPGALPHGYAMSGPLFVQYNPDFFSFDDVRVSKSGHLSYHSASAPVGVYTGRVLGALTPIIFSFGRQALPGRNLNRLADIPEPLRPTRGYSPNRCVA